MYFIFCEILVNKTSLSFDEMKLNKNCKINSFFVLNGWYGHITKKIKRQTLGIVNISSVPKYPKFI